MSIFASQTSAKVEIPMDPPNWVQVRRLTGRECEQAQAAHREAFLGVSPRLWSPTLRKVIQGQGTNADALQALSDPLLGYDRFSVVRSGLVAWSYPQSVKVIQETGFKGDPPASDAIGDLCDEAVDFIATEIMRLTKPALFVASEEAETAQKEAQATVPVVAGAGADAVAVSALSAD